MNIKNYSINFLMITSISLMFSMNALAGDIPIGNPLNVKRKWAALFNDEDENPADNSTKKIKTSLCATPHFFPEPILSFSEEEDNSTLEFAPIPLPVLVKPDFNFGGPKSFNNSNNLRCPKTPAKNQVVPTIDKVAPLLANSFQELELLGKGSQATVFKAFSQKRKTYVALRVLQATKHNKKKIKKEKKYIKKIPNNSRVIRVLKKFEKGPFIFVMTDFFPKDLARYLSETISNQSSVPEDILWSFITDIALGLNELEQNNLVHRDIKPENLFLDDNSRVVIGDLGMLVRISGDPDKDSDMGFDVGDSRYAAIEFLQNDMISPKADIASFGFSMLELMAQVELPNEGDEWNSVRKIGGAESFLNRAYSEELKQLIRDMINPDPTQRPAAGEILKHRRVKQVLETRIE